VEHALTGIVNVPTAPERRLSVVKETVSVKCRVSVSVPNAAVGANSGPP